MSGTDPHMLNCRRAICDALGELSRQPEHLRAPALRPHLMFALHELEAFVRHRGESGAAAPQSKAFGEELAKDYR